MSTVLGHYIALNCKYLANIRISHMALLRAETHIKHSYIHTKCIYNSNMSGRPEIV